MYYYKTSKDYDKLIGLLDGENDILGYITKNGRTDAVAFVKDRKGHYLAGTSFHVQIAAYKDRYRDEDEQRKAFIGYLREVDAEYVMPEHDED